MSLQYSASANSRPSQSKTSPWQIVSIGLIAASFLLFSIASASAAGSYDPPKASQKSNLHKEFVKAGRFIAANEYKQALSALSNVIADEPENADAWNLKGFSHRKIGAYEAAEQAYLKALELNPKHTRAMEYMGELYLTLNQLDKAEALLARLNKACFFNCKDRDMLKKAIAAYKQANS